jgi:Peptidase family M23
MGLAMKSVDMQRISRRSLAVAILASATSLVVCVSARSADEPLNVTPVLLAVHDAPVPFTGSDGLIHLVYELWMTNFSSSDAAVEKVEVVGDGAVLQNLDSAAVTRRLQPAGLRESVGTLAKSAQALLFINVTLARDAKIPRELSHHVTVRVSAAPPGHQEISESGGTTAIDQRSVAIIGPPLSGDRFVSADSCCDAIRHTRAALPVNGRVRVAQRFAVDWEQLDADGHIYAGPRARLESYTIFGKPVLAVADAVVASVVEGVPEQTPGTYPTDISLDAADGNAIILDLGQNRYALYAHLQTHSIKVRQGEKVKRGQVLALVGNTGNSVAPHLHFQLTDESSSLGSNGLPYEIDDFQVAGKTPGTEAFDEAEGKGTPLAVAAISPSLRVKNAMPLDQLVISFTAK